MLSDQEYNAWFLRSGLPHKARSIIDLVRSMPPFRNPRASAGNTPVTFPSIKMDCTIMGESGTVEFACVRECEYQNDDVYEYYDQPAARVWHEYMKNGRRVRPFERTADYFVIGETWTGWVECKTLAELLRMEEENPGMYCRDEHGRWRCPSGENYAAKVGLGFRVYSSAETNWVWQHNMDFLDDYRRGHQIPVPEHVAEVILDLVRAYPGVTLAELRALAAQIVADER